MLTLNGPMRSICGMIGWTTRQFRRDDRYRRPATARDDSRRPLRCDFANASRRPPVTAWFTQRGARSSSSVPRALA